MTMDNDLDGLMENEDDNAILMKGDWSRFAQIESIAHHQEERAERELANVAHLKIENGMLNGKVRDPTAKEMKRNLNCGVYGGRVVTRIELEQQGMQTIGPGGYGKKLNYQEPGSRGIMESF